jgi:hypothetical protein
MIIGNIFVFDIHRSFTVPKALKNALIPLVCAPVEVTIEPWDDISKVPRFVRYLGEGRIEIFPDLIDKPGDYKFKVKRSGEGFIDLNEFRIKVKGPRIKIVLKTTGPPL